MTDPVRSNVRSSNTTSGGGLIGWLLVLIAGVGASVWQLRENVPDRQVVAAVSRDEAMRPQKLFDWEPEQVRELRLIAAGRQRVFQRAVAAGDAGGRPQAGSEGSPPMAWREIDAPGPGLPFDPQTYLSLLSQARVDRVLPAAGPDALNGFGLTSPVLRVEVEGADGVQLAQLSMGNKTPDGYGRYVLLPRQDGVSIIPGYQFNAALEALAMPGK